MFVEFLSTSASNPHELQELDGLAVQYKNANQLSRSQVDYLLASLELFFPSLKHGGLTWLERVSGGMAASHRTKHTVPLPSKPARFFGAHLSSAGKRRMGFGIAFQQALGLRPCELRLLEPEHVMIPDGGVGQFVLRLSAEVNTKVKREQFAILHSAEFPDLAYLLLLLVAATPDSHKLFPFSYNAYNASIAAVEAQLGLQLGVTPHSPRAGFASELAAAGTPVATIKERGRWWSELFFRTYVDVVTAAQVQAMVGLTGFREGLEYAAVNFVKYFSHAAFLAEVSRHAASGIREGPAHQHLRAEGVAVSWESYQAANCHAKAKQPLQEGTREPKQQRGARAGGSGSRHAKGQGKGRSSLLLPKGSQ